MKEIILSSLHLKNFKGIEDLKAEFQGSTNIFGANEQGKSTLHTGWMWLLTGKDEFDRKDYEIKNTKKKDLNVQGHEVMGRLLVDGEPVTLKRIYWEDWQKSKGQSQKVFKGHYTEYFYNDAPVSATEYQKKVDDIIPSKIIKLVTNPTYFNTLDWRDQRRGLIGIAGQITDKEIIDSIVTPENDFGTLIMVLNSKKTVEEWKSQLSAKRLLLEKKIKEYNPRIDEAKHNMPEVQDWEALEKEKTRIDGEISNIETMLADSGKMLSEKQKEINAKNNDLFKKRNDLLDIKNKYKNDIQAKNSDVPNRISSLKSQLRTVTENIERIKGEIKKKQESIENCKTEVTRLDGLINQNKIKWDEINKEKFSFDDKNTTCPTCKQPLPADQIETKKETLLKNFNADVKNRKQAEVNKSDISKGEKASQEHKIDALATEIINLENDIELESVKIAPLENSIKDLQKSLETIETKDVNSLVDQAVQGDQAAIDLLNDISKLEEEISAEKGSLENPDNSAHLTKKNTLSGELKEVENKLALRVTITKTEERIKQLETEEKATAQEIADVERQELEVEMYNRANNDLIQNRVNGMFKHVQFRLFHKQVNGELAETCVCEYKGVAYPTLNTAAKMLAGLDVIRTFQQYYGISVPVFCDNRESVTDIPDTGSQVISLFVSPEDKTLRVERA